MFDVGFSELLLTGLVALIVLGPERLPKAARLAGMWIRRARLQWQAVKSELENELADEDMRRSILRARDDLRDAQESLRRQLADVEARMTRASDAPAASEGALPHADAEPAAVLEAPRVDAAPLQAQLADVEARMTAPSSVPTDAAQPVDAPSLAPGPSPHEQR